jgi:hypothetical protein
MTFDLSAFSQYSLQYLLSCSRGQSHAPCAHLFALSSAIFTSTLLGASMLNLGSWPNARRDLARHHRDEMAF